MTNTQTTMDSAFFKTIVEAQLDGVIVIDQKAVIRYVNPAAAALLEWSVEEMEGQPFQWPMQTEKPLEVDISTQDGGFRTVLLKFTPAHWNVEPVYLVSVLDISEQLREERLLRQAVDAADTRTSELEAIKFVADQLNQVAMLEDAIQAGLDTILALVHAEAVWVLLPEEDKSKRLVVIYGSDTLLRSEKRSLGPEFNCGCLSRLLKGELKSDGEWFTDLVGLENAGLSRRLSGKHLCFPLQVKGEKLGVLNITVAEEMDFSRDEITMLSGISYQLAVAISRTRTYTKAVEAMKYEESMSSISRTISSALDLPTVLQNIVRIAVDLTDAEAGSLGMITPNGQYLTFLSNYPEHISQASLAKGEDLVWDMIASGKPQLIKAADAVSLELPADFAQNSCYLIMVPVIASGEVMGILVLYTLSEDKDLSQFDMALVESLGQQAGIAVQNAQLFFEVQQLTISDTLTGLNNQRSFINQAMKELERAWRYRRPLSIVSLVLDDLRQINETGGMEAGDQALRLVAGACLEHLRRVDITGRYEGNNFVILLPETSQYFAEEVAQRLLERIQAKHVQTEEIDQPLKVSMGVASLQEGEMVDLDMIIDRANHALYQSVQEGGGKVSLWQAS